MILNTTHLNKKTKKKIADFIGDEFSFFEKIKLGGIGSYKMMIDNSSAEIEKKLNHNQGINYCNIELRKNGIMIHFHDSNYEKNSWLIPFYKLVIYKTERFSIYSDTIFLKLIINKNFKLNKSFFHKLGKLKESYLENYQLV
jgi:hypothetical protein